jgi:Ser/Thr protein kinase RdoA (MazF antagonist)
MILEDAGPPLRGRTDVALWERLLRTFAQIQQAYAGHPGQSGRDGQVAALLALGCADRRLDVLASQVDPLLDDAGPLDGVEPALVERLRAQAPRLRAMCAELAAAGVPPALVHGDLHAGNVAATDGDPVFFDWTDACVAHPFLDYVTIVGDDPARLGGDLARAAGRLRDAYLQPWTAYAPAARLRPALELGTTLGALHQAVSYQMITRSVEPAARHEWSGAMRSWLRRVLRRLEA